MGLGVIVAVALIVVLAMKVVRALKLVLVLLLVAILKANLVLVREILMVRYVVLGVIAAILIVIPAMKVIVVLSLLLLVQVVLVLVLLLNLAVILEIQMAQYVALQMSVMAPVLGILVKNVHLVVVTLTMVVVPVLLGQHVLEAVVVDLIPVVTSAIPVMNQELILPVVVLVQGILMISSVIFVRSVPREVVLMNLLLKICLMIVPKVQLLPMVVDQTIAAEQEIPVGFKLRVMEGVRHATDARIAIWLANNILMVLRIQ